MKHLGILVGTDADLPEELAKQNEIMIYPFAVHWEGHTGNMQDKDVLYTAMRQPSPVGSPQTSQPAPQVFLDHFQTLLKTYQDILVLTISSEVSGCFNSARQAQQQLPEIERNRIHIVDSQASTGAEGLLALKARELSRERKSIQEILTLLSLSQVRLFGTFDDPSWAQKGGRLSSIQATLVRHMIAQGFRPVLTLKKGQIATHKIQMGTKEKVPALLAQLKDVCTPETSFTYAITHGDCPDQAEKLHEQIKVMYPNANCAYTNTLSAVLAAHVGPDSLVLSLLMQ